MILRRFMKHVSDQNWFAVGLDVIVVITGIFLGMQVTEWNEERKERGQETVYLERLIVDLRGDLEILAFGQRTTEDRLNQIALLELVVADPNQAADNPALFMSSIERSSWESFLPVEPRSWEELTSSGKTLLIGSAPLREGLSEHYREIRRWRLILDGQAARRHFSDASAGLLTTQQLTAIEKASEVYNDKAVELEISKEDAVKVAQRLAANKKAVRWLPQMAHYHVLTSEVIDIHFDSIQELLELIEDRMKEVSQ